jgi:hypothetical protein
MAAIHEAAINISCWQQEQLVPNECSFTPNSAQQGAAGGAHPGQQPARNKVKGGNKASDAEEDAGALVRPAPRTLDSRWVMPACASECHDQRCNEASTLLPI